jgi:2-oxoglutarate ferredoxin oxidoreductase subunit beta
VRQVAKSMSEVFKKKGFCFIEIISPCPTLFQRRNRLGDGLDTMKYYKEKSKVRNGVSTAGLDMTLTGEIIVGKFVDRERPDYLETMKAQMRARLGEKYIDPKTRVEEEGCECD